MIFTFDKYGNLIESDTEDTLVQYSENANTLYASFKDIDLNEYIAKISFERADGELSPEIAMSYAGNNIAYQFSDAWITAKAGILKCVITLFQNNIVKKTASFNLNVVSSLKGRAIGSAEDVIIRALETRTYALEQGVATLLENGMANVQLYTDVVTTQVDLKLKNYSDYTYKAKNLVSVKVTLGDNVVQGFLAGLNFQADNDGVTFEIINQTDYPIYVWKNGLQVGQIPGSFTDNELLQSVFLCDGLAIHWYFRTTMVD